MPEKNYRIRIARGDAEFEAEGDKAFVLDMLKRFETISLTTELLPKKAGAGRAIAAGSEGAALPTRSMSPAEFIRQHKFKQHPDIVLAFGYYLEHTKGMKDFAPADINRLYYEAKIEPSNISMACLRSVERGLLMEARGAKKGAKKRYMLTDSGERHVESNKLLD